MAVECPNCKGNNLKVVEVVWQGETPLDEDGGFSLLDGKTHGTLDEKAKCDGCGRIVSLEDIARQ